MSVIRNWFGEAGFLRLLRNAGHLFSGSIIGSVLSFLAFLIAARLLGVEDYGRLAIVLAFAAVVERLFIFSSWQSVIRYGAPLWRADGAAAENFAVLLKFSVVLDVTGAILAALFGAGIVLLFGDWFAWSTEFQALMLVYLLSVLLNFTGMPIGLLRIADRFRWLGIHAGIAGAMKLLAVAVVAAIDGGLGGVVAALCIATIAGHLLLMALAWLELRRHAIVFAAAPLRGVWQRFPGLRGFAVSTNLNASVHVLGREGDVLVVGALMGDAATGLYKLAKQFGAVLGRVADPLYNAIYPDLSALVGRGQRAAALGLMLRMSALTAVIGLAAVVGFLLVGAPVIEYTLGIEYLVAYSVVAVYLVGMVISIVSMPLQPMMLALGRAHRTLLVHALATAVYLTGLLLVGAMGMGVVWAAMAFVAQGIVWAVLMGGYVFRERAV